MKLYLNRWNVAASAAVLLLLGGCGSESDPAVENPMVQASVDLDKDYVPSLFYSNINPVPNEPFALNAKATLDTLTGGWNGFKSTIDTAVGSIDLTSYYTSIDGNVLSANSLIETVIAGGIYPADITVAHDALESIRDTLGEMRGAVALNYFMDGVTIAHHAMEPVSGAYTTYATDANITQLCASLETSLPAYDTAWGDVYSDYSESSIAALYDLSTEKSGMLTTNVEAMTATVSALSTAMTDCIANEADVAAEAAKIKPTFVKTFLAFGDFITPFMEDMIIAEQQLIPILYCTGNPGDEVCAAGPQAQLNSFQTAFTAFKGHYPVIPGKLDLPGTIYWKSDFTAVTDAIAAAQLGIDDANLSAAHIAMEEVRGAMYHLRSTFENYDFITDRVTDYHDAMEPIALAVKGLVDPSEVNQSVKDAIIAALPNAMRAMRTLQRDVPNLDLAAFGLDATWLLTQNISIADQLANLQSLQDALDSDTAADILSAAQLVKPKFIPFFKAFGDFTPLAT